MELTMTVPLTCVLVVLAAIAAGLLHLGRDYDPYADRPGYYQQRPRCGATNGDLLCTLEPHATGLHLDERAGSLYHSAPFRAKT